MIVTLNQIYHLDASGEPYIPIQSGTYVEKHESRLFAKLKQEITPGDIQREKEYQEYLNRLNNEY